MTNSKISFAGLIIISILFPCISKGEVVDGINYSLSGSNARVVQHTPETGEYTGDIVIPETIIYNGKTYTVTQINKDCFTNNSITSITIPGTVTTIQNNIADGLTNLKQLIFQDGETDLKFGNSNSLNYCFNNCQIETIYIGRDLIYYSDNSYLFSGPSSRIGSFSFSKSIVKFPDNAFFSTKLLDINNGIFEFPEGIQKLGKNSLNINNLSKLIFPSTLTDIASPLSETFITTEEIVLESKAIEPMEYRYEDASPFNGLIFEQLIVPFNCKQKYIDAGWSVIAKEIVEAEEETDNPEIVYLRLKMPQSSEGYCYPKFEISSGEDFSIVLEVENGWTISDIVFESDEVNISDSPENIRRYKEVENLATTSLEKSENNHYKISVSNISTSGSLTYVMEREIPTEVRNVNDISKKPIVIPTRNSITVSASAGTKVSVYNINGTLLKSGRTLEDSPLIFDGLDSGIYIVKADTYTFKLAL